MTESAGDRYGRGCIAPRFLHERARAGRPDEGNADSAEAVATSYIRYRVSRLLGHYLLCSQGSSDALEVLVASSLRLVLQVMFPRCDFRRLGCRCTTRQYDPPVDASGALGASRVGFDFVLGTTLGEAVPFLKIDLVLAPTSLSDLAQDSWALRQLLDAMHQVIPIAFDFELRLLPETGEGLFWLGRGEDAGGILGLTAVLPTSSCPEESVP